MDWEPVTRIEVEDGTPLVLMEEAERRLAARDQRIEELEAEIATFIGKRDAMQGVIGQLRGMRAKSRTEIEDQLTAAQQDTARIDWLSDQHNYTFSGMCFHGITVLGESDVRRSIDTAMEEV